MSEKNYITQSELKRLFHYCPDTGAFTNKVSRCGNTKDAIAGTKTKSDYTNIHIHKIRYKAHRLVFLYMTGSYPTLEVDHINRIKHDNRWSNLREVSAIENCKNKPMYKSNTSGVTGVSWRRDQARWVARISIGGKNINLGRFNCITAAAIARKAAEIKHGFHPNHGA